MNLYYAYDPALDEGQEEPRGPLHYGWYVVAETSAQARHLAQQEYSYCGEPTEYADMRCKLVRHDVEALGLEPGVQMDEAADRCRGLNPLAVADAEETVHDGA